MLGAAADGGLAQDGDTCPPRPPDRFGEYVRGDATGGGPPQSGAGHDDVL